MTLQEIPLSPEDRAEQAIQRSQISLEPFCRVDLKTWITGAIREAENAEHLRICNLLESITDKYEDDNFVEILKEHPPH